MSKSTSEYWREWFDDRAEKASSDYVLNRGTTLRLDKLEARSSKQFLEAVQPSATDVILDAGCGSGRNLTTFSSKVKAMVGLDFSEQMLERARERVARENLSNVTLAQGSVTQVSYPDSYFDKVVCASVLQYLDTEDCARAICEMARVCKPGGRLVLHVKNGTSLYALSLRLMRLVLRALGRNVMPEHYRSRRWHVATLEKCGAEMVDYDSFGIFTFVPMPRALIRGALAFELRFLRGKWLKRFGVNFQITAQVDHHSLKKNS